MRKKILFILPSLEAGGAERIITIIANSLNQKEFEPVLVLFEKKGVYLDHLKPHLRIVELNVSRIRFSIFKVIPVIRKEKPQIVFSGWGEISALLSPIVPFFKKTKFIARETNVVSQHVKRKEIRFLYRFYNNFHKIIAQSDDMRQDLIENIGVKATKITKINNPIDFDWINQKLAEPNSVQLNNPTYKQVVAIGNVSYRKGFDNLIKVFGHLKDDAIFLNILGDGPQTEAFKELAKQLGVSNIQFWGMQSNPFQFLKMADLFVLSSRHEGFPNVLLEAGACGVFALANNCKGGINEIIQIGVNGKISDIENHAAFANDLKQCLRNEQSATKIIESVKSRYEKSLILKQYQRLFDSL